MVWELLAVWAIVGGVVLWFIRDEKQRRDRVLSARAKRFAETPYRRASERLRQEDETLAGAHAARVVAGTTETRTVASAAGARAVAAMEPAPAPEQQLAPHAQEFIAQLRAEGLAQA